MAKNTTYKAGTPVHDDDEYVDEDVKAHEDAVLDSKPVEPVDPAQEKRDADKKAINEAVVKRMDDFNLSRADAENREYEKRVLQEGGQTTSPPLPRDRLAPEQPPTPHEGVSTGSKPNSATNPRFAYNDPKQGLPEVPEGEQTVIDGIPAHQN